MALSVAEIEGALRIRDEWSSTFEAAERRLQSFISSVDSSNPAVTSLEDKLSSLGSKSLALGATLTAVSAPLALLAKSSIDAAMAAVESENLFEVSFGGMSAAARAWSDNLSGSLGLNAFELRKQSGMLFTMTQSMGLAKDEAFKMSMGIVELANDFASFYNLPSDVAFEKIRAGIVGEAEPLKALGIIVNETATKQAAYTHGLVRQGATLTEVQKVQARFLAIMDQTKNAQGDLARTIDSPTNQLRVQAQAFEQLKVQIGTALMPIMNAFIALMRELLPVLQDAVKWFTELPQPVQMTGAAIGALAIAAGPLLVALGGLSYSVSAAIPLLTALGVTTTSLGAMFGSLTASLVTLLAQAAMVWASFEIGWQIGKKIREAGEGGGWFEKHIASTKELDRDMQNLLVTMGLLEKRAGDTGTQGIAEFSAKMAASEEGAKKLRAEHEKLHASTVKVTAATTDNLRATLTAANNNKLLEQAGKLLGKSVTDVTEAKRILALQSEITSTGESKATKIAKEQAEAMKALSKSMADHAKSLQEKSAATRSRQDLLNTLLGFDPTDATIEMGRLAAAVDKVGGAANVNDKQIVALVDKLQKLASVGGDNEHAFKVLGEVMSEGANRSDELAGKLGFVTDAEVKAKKAALALEEALKHIGDGKFLGASFGDLFKADLGKALEGLPEVILDAFQGGGDVFRSIGSFMGGKLFGPDSALWGASVDFITSNFGEKIGGAIGSVIPGIGALIGPALGGLVGKVFGGLFGGEGKKVNDMRDQFISAAGGLDALNKQAHAAGTTLDELLRADKVTEFEAAVAHLTGAIDFQGASTQAVNDAMERYGLTIGEMGPKFQQQQLDEMVGQLIQDYKLLEASGADMNAVIEKMAPNTQRYIDAALAAGSAIPESMRPIIEKMIEQGLLLDANGEAFTSVEDAGLSFTQTMSEQFTTLIEKIDRMVNALLGINNIDVSPRINFPDMPDLESRRGDVPGHASGFFSSSLPHDYVFRAHRGERVEVTPANQTPDRNAQDGNTWAGGGSNQHPEFHFYLGGEELRGWIMRQSLHGFFS